MQFLETLENPQKLLKSLKTIKNPLKKPSKTFNNLQKPPKISRNHQNPSKTIEILGIILLFLDLALTAKSLQVSRCLTDDDDDV